MAYFLRVEVFITTEILIVVFCYDSLASHYRFRDHVKSTLKIENIFFQSTGNRLHGVTTENTSYQLQ